MKKFTVFLISFLLFTFSTYASTEPKLDPIRFTVKTNASQVGLNEEFEISITAQYLTIPNNSVFVFEGSNSFKIRMIFPDGFVQTGGNYHDLIGGELSRSKPTSTFTIRGKFTSDAQNDGRFQLLRSHKNADDASAYVQVGMLNYSLGGSEKLTKDDSKRIAVIDPAGFVPYLNITQLRTGSADVAQAVYITDLGKSGLFQLDSLDATTADDSVMVLVSSSKRYKRVSEFITPEMFGAKGDGTTNDYAAIQKAFNFNVKKIVFRNGVSYKVNSGLTLDITQRMVDGNGSTLNFSSLTSGVAITLRGTMNPSFDAAALSYFKNFVIKGNLKGGNVTALYLNETSSSGTIANVTFSNVSVSNFGTGIKSGNKAYINTFNECNSYANGIGVLIEGGTYDSGSSNRFVNCSIFGNVLAVRLDRIADTKFSNCVLGENEKHIVLSEGTGFFDLCHIEGADYAGPMVELTGGNGTGLIFTNCEFVTNSVAIKPDYLFTIAPSDNNSRKIELTNCLISFSGTAVNIALCGGAPSKGSRFVINNSRTYWNNFLPLVTHEANNILANGSFENTDLATDDVFVTEDTAPITSPLSGTNLNISSYSGTASAGTKSLKITKVGGGGTKARVAIAVPCKPNTLYKGAIRFKQLGSTAGPVQIGIGFGKVLKTGTIYTMKNGRSDYYGFYGPTTTWTAPTGINDFGFKTSANDTHVYFDINLDNWGAGDLIIDDLKIFEY